MTSASALVIQARRDIESIGGSSISTGMALEAQGYDVMRLEAALIEIINR